MSFFMILVSTRTLNGENMHLAYDIGKAVLSVVVCQTTDLMWASVGYNLTVHIGLDLTCSYIVNAKLIYPV